MKIFLGLLFISFYVNAKVDLHSHLAMEKMLSPIFKGKLLETAAATDWKSRFKSRADFESLEKSGLKIIVVAISIHTLWGDPEKQIDDQIALLKEFCTRHPNWKIVAEPYEAEEAIKNNQKVFVLSLEGAPYFQDKALFDRVINNHPIRVVTPIHFTDFKQIMGRPARQDGLFGWLLDKYFYFFGHNVPITVQGKELLTQLIEKKIWVDLSHATPDYIKYFLQVRPKNYPSLVTHTVLRKYLGHDRGIDEDLLVEIAKDGGLVGLLATNDMLANTPEDKFDCKKNYQFVTQWNELREKLKWEQLLVGSDLNAPIPSLPPSDGLVDCQGKSVQLGWTTAAELPGILNLESPQAVDFFIQTWKRVRPTE